MTAIRATSLTRTFGDLRALDELTFAVESGEVYGLLGPNGSGKTTTINVLTGVLAPDGGNAEVLGIDPTADPVGVRDAIGVLPEKEAPPSFLTPREYFGFVGDVRGMTPEAVADRVEDWADRLDLVEKLDTLCTDLSRGQQQKVMLTQAFIHDPELVFIDEPLANLDPLVQDAVLSFVEDYHAEGGTVLLSTHHLEVAERLCTRVGIVHAGRLIEEFDADSDVSLRTAFREAVEARDGPADPEPVATTEP